MRRWQWRNSSLSKGGPWNAVRFLQLLRSARYSHRSQQRRATRRRLKPPRLTSPATRSSCAALGHGPGVLMVHGFPRTSLMWRFLAPKLADTHTVVCADLRAYGRSGTPPSADDHFPYSKRAMAKELVEVMS